MPYHANNDKLKPVNTGSLKPINTDTPGIGPKWAGVTTKQALLGPMLPYPAIHNTLKPTTGNNNVLTHWSL